MHRHTRAESFVVSTCRLPLHGFAPKTQVQMRKALVRNTHYAEVREAICLSLSRALLWSTKTCHRLSSLVISRLSSPVHLEYDDTPLLSLSDDTPLLSLSLSLLSFHSARLQMLLLNDMLGRSGWCGLRPIVDCWCGLRHIGLRQIVDCHLGEGVKERH